MPRTGSRPSRDAFISHASADLKIAEHLENALKTQGFEVWLDRSQIQLGVLLGDELRASISACRVLILLWSAAAAASRWVNTEWIAAHHLDRFIVPVVLDDTLLPQCFEHTIYVDLRGNRDAEIMRLAKAVSAAQIGANPLPAPMRAEAPELREAIQAMAAGQKVVTDALGERKFDGADQMQTLLDEVMRPVLAAWPMDPMIVKLDGYHIKNGYMIRHWDALQSGRGPADPALEQAERRFFEALWIDPEDAEGLDGLGSILMLRRDLHAAEFFFLSAIREAKRLGIHYGAADENLKAVRWFLNRRPAHASTGKGRARKAEPDKG